MGWDGFINEDIERAYEEYGKKLEAEYAEMLCGEYGRVLQEGYNEELGKELWGVVDVAVRKENGCEKFMTCGECGRSDGMAVKLGFEEGERWGVEKKLTLENIEKVFNDYQEYGGELEENNPKREKPICCWEFLQMYHEGFIGGYLEGVK
jgi:hypothetical protein